MKEFWNQRFAEPGFIYGEHPNEFFRDELVGLSPGLLFLPAEGQGRNAVHAAREGWRVLAADYSETGQSRAMELAARHGVQITYQVADLTDREQRKAMLAEGPFDAIGVVFMHLAPDDFDAVMEDLCAALRPGGRLIAELFSKDQIGYPSGGPKDPDMLHTPEALDSLLSSRLDEVTVWQQVVVLDEGEYHRGPGSVVRVRGIR